MLSVGWCVKCWCVVCVSRLLCCVGCVDWYCSLLVGSLVVLGKGLVGCVVGSSCHLSYWVLTVCADWYCLLIELVCWLVDWLVA